VRPVARWAICSVIWGVGCGASNPSEPTLGDASREVQFESVDRLGPHRYLASIRHRASRPDGGVDRTDEAVEIRWQDWDTFEFRRVVDAELQSAVVTVDGRPWSLRSKGRWELREDAEPYRLDLRQSWNAWDQALEPFKDRILLEEEGAELFEGRAVRRYAVRLAPEPEDANAPRGKGKRRRKLHEPAETTTLVSLSGRVWVDEGTAVRLQADVTGELEHRGRTRTVELQLTRSGIGLAQDIQPPKGASKRMRPASLPEPDPTNDTPTPEPSPAGSPTPAPADP
jgi:hypothetical protein